MEDALEFAMRKGLSGLEWAGGLPGTLGGAIRGNAGAFGGEIKDAVAEVTSLDIFGRTPKVLTRKAGDCRFDYRTSIFKEKSGTEVVLSAVLKLKQGDRKAIRGAVEEKVAYRSVRHPMEYPNIGSIFKNVDWCKVPHKHRNELSKIVKLDPFPVVPAAYLIAQAGLKGVAYGGAEISPKHPNFIVNVLEAKASEVKQLIKLVKMKVNEQFGVTLEEEVMYV
jgi:UDP-N-acetylmuramate dehydrogenase